MTEEPKPPQIEASVWRLGRGGLLISSVVERHVAQLAESEPDTIFFYADLGTTSQVMYTEETITKVYDALGRIGLSERQMMNAVNEMQNAGILFRERMD